MTDTKTPAKADLITELVAAGQGSESTLRRRTLAQLTEMVAALGCGGCDNGEHCGTCECCEQAENAALPAEEPVATQPTPDATKNWEGNYNTVFVPLAAAVAPAGLTVWVENVSAMLRRTHVAGPDAKEFVARLAAMEPAAVAALRVWQRGQAEARKGLTDMAKYNQNRAFLSGYGQAALSEKKITKGTRPVAFAKDMDRAMVDGAEGAFAAGLAAGKVEA